MSNDPYPGQRPDPRDDTPYSSDPYDPYVPSQGSSPQQPPAYEPGRSAPLSARMPPGPGMPPPYPYAPVQHTEPNTSAIVLVILSSLALLTGYCCYIGIPGLVLGILGITKQQTDPEGAARLTKIGWISFAVLTVITVLAVIAFVVAIVLAES